MREKEERKIQGERREIQRRDLLKTRSFKMLNYRNNTDAPPQQLRIAGVQKKKVWFSEGF